MPCNAGSRLLSTARLRKSWLRTTTTPASRCAMVPAWSIAAALRTVPFNVTTPDDTDTCTAARSGSAA
jgi:hypothetical protein